jgi:hypothetical protein
LLLAFLEIGLIASGLSLFWEKLGALAAALGGFVGLCWPLGVLLFERPQLTDVAIIGVLPLVVTLDACWRLITRRQASWLEITEGPNFVLRAALCALPVVIVSVIAFPLITAVEERYMIPGSFIGEVVIVYGIKDGLPENRTTSGAIVYEIPESGVLITTGQPVRGWSRDKYYYRRPDGSLESIQNIWNTTIHDTPANRADSSVGIYLRAGIGKSNGPSCSFEFKASL